MKIAKRYRPELVVSKGKEPNPLLTDPYLDAKEERLVSTNGAALVALPVSTEKDERSRYLGCSLLAAARGLGDPELPAEIEDQEVVEFGVLWPTAQERTFPDWASLVPKFKRGSTGTVSFALDACLLKNVASAMGVAGVVLTIELGTPEDRPSPIVVQPLDDQAEELGLLMPLRADGAGETKVDPDQVCPKCRRLLAAGAACPEHGRPSAASPPPKRPSPEVAEAVGRVRGALADLQAAHPGAKVSVRIGDGPARPLGGGAAGEPPALAWDRDGDHLTAAAPRGTYVIEPRGSGFAVMWAPPRGRPKKLHDTATEAAAKDLARKHLLESAGDALLENAGDGELARKDLKGPAAARKKGGRR